MHLDIFHLEARSAFHFGERGVGIEESSDHAPSDTLFSALCNTVRISDSLASLEAMLGGFADNRPPFLLSGGFPYVPQGEKLLRFFPSPASFAALSPGAPYVDIDPCRSLGKLSKIAWLSESVFVDWLNGKITRSWLAEHTVLLPNQVLVKRDEADRLLKQYGSLHLWGVDDVTRVAVDRITNASNVYQAGRLAFVKGGGLWCAVSCLDWDVSDVRRVLGLMEDGGIGGERFSGYGQFKLLERSFALDLPAPSERPGFVTLSHYYPQRTERAVFGANAAYSIIQRRGWMSSPDGSNLRRPAVRMIAAGGVLHSLSGENVYGGLADVTPGAFGRHPVWRYGYALGIGAYLA